MARVIPETLPISGRSASERVVLDAIRECVSDDWIVFQGYPYRRYTKEMRKKDSEFARNHPGHRQNPYDGEIDFLFFRPGSGFVVLEVKGGEIRHENGDWFQNGYRIFPVQQTTRNKFFIRDELNKRLLGTGSLKFAHAFCFPDAGKLEGDIPPSCVQNLVLLANDLRRLGTRIGEILEKEGEAYGHGNGPSTEDILQVLEPRFRYSVPLGVSFSVNAETFRKLEDEQYEFLRSVRDFPRLRIRAGAGAGTNAMACRLARDWAATGLRVGLFSYGTTLPDELLRLLDGGHEGITVAAFLDFCVRSVGTDMNLYRSTLRKDDSFWNDVLPAQWKEHVEKTGLRYDAIIVIEGHDFLPSAWDMFRAILAPKGRFYIFYDPKKNVYRRRMADIPNFDRPDLYLDRNCRTTRAICRELERLSGTEIRHYPDVPEGLPIEVLEAADEKGCLRLLKEFVAGLTARKAPPLHENLVILGSHSFRNSGIPGGMRCNSRYEVTDGYKPNKTASIPYYTFMKFEGAERPIVVLYGVDEKDERWSHPENVYTAMSCATHLVCIIRKTSPAATRS